MIIDQVMGLLCICFRSVNKTFIVIFFVAGEGVQGLLPNICNLYMAG